MSVCSGGHAASARSSGQETDLHKVRLVDVFDGDSLFAYSGGEGLQTDGAAAVVFYHSLEHTSVVLIKAELV